MKIEMTCCDLPELFMADSAFDIAFWPFRVNGLKPPSAERFQSESILFAGLVPLLLVLSSGFSFLGGRHIVPS